MGARPDPGPCVALVSGGLDSAVALFHAVRRGGSVHALTFRYGQRHLLEVSLAKKLCKAAGVARHLLFDVDLSRFGGSSLTGDKPVPKGRLLAGRRSIPSTYVPARNTVFLSLALSWAEAIGARDIFTGVSAVDYSGYPDCRPAFIEAFGRMANLGTRAADGGKLFRIQAPLIGMTKGETVKKGVDLGVDFGLTWSCYDPKPGPSPCRACEACRLRAKGFREAGVRDPLLARRGRKG